MLRPMSDSSILDQFVVTEVAEIPQGLRSMSPDDWEAAGLPRRFAAMTPEARAVALRAARGSAQPVAENLRRLPDAEVDAELSEQEQAEINARNQALDEQIVAEFGTLDPRPVDPAEPADPADPAEQVADLPGEGESSEL